MTDAEMLRLLMRVQAGTLTAVERAELAELVADAAAATEAIEDNPAQAQDPAWVAKAWEPVGRQVHVLLDTARDLTVAPVSTGPDPVVRPGFDDPHRMVRGVLVAVGLVALALLVSFVISDGWWLLW